MSESWGPDKKVIDILTGQPQQPVKRIIEPTGNGWPGEITHDLVDPPVREILGEQYIEEEEADPTTSSLRVIITFSIALMAMFSFGVAIGTASQADEVSPWLYIGTGFLSGAGVFLVIGAWLNYKDTES